MIELAKQYLPIEQYELTDWLPIGETEKLRERQFDLIHSSLVLQHISASEADNAVNLFADIIAPRGLLVMWSRSSMDLAAGTVWDYVLKRFGPISRFDKSAADKDPNDHQLVLFRKYQ
jgi:predicted SAM-dependent methyltransferase